MKLKWDQSLGNWIIDQTDQGDAFPELAGVPNAMKNTGTAGIQPAMQTIVQPAFDSSLYPYDTVVYITDTIGGVSWQGSGVLIEPNEVLTASHVVYSSVYGVASNVEVTPAYNAGFAPFGTAAGTYVHYFPIQNPGGLISTYWSQFDYAVIHLSTSFTGLGTMGISYNFPYGNVNVTGFPGSAGGLMDNSAQYVFTDYPYSLLEGLALGEGSSGGPVWYIGSGGLPYVVGDVSSASGATGYFTQITATALTNIETWEAEDATLCIAAGTWIRTDQGEVAIEDLDVGDMVRLADGTLSRIIWIGHRAVTCSTHLKPECVWPVRIAAHAFGNGTPRRDLWLSPDHAVYVDRMLIPAKYLMNGKTIVQEPRAVVTYYHIELGRHDVLLAEGLPVESYLDTGNRSRLADIGNQRVLKHADSAMRTWEAEGCAPLVVTGPELNAARHVLTAPPA